MDELSPHLTRSDITTAYYQLDLGQTGLRTAYINNEKRKQGHNIRKSNPDYYAYVRWVKQRKDDVKNRLKAQGLVNG